MLSVNLTAASAVVLFVIATSPVLGQDQPAPGQPLRLDPAEVGALGSGRWAELALPESRRGPAPAVVVLHGCNGVTEHIRDWARRFVAWGYAALIVDSLRPRGTTNVCGRPDVVPSWLRAQDALLAADAHLRTRPEIDPDRVAVVGFSHGGSAALHAARQIAVARAGTPPFKAAAAFYPRCPDGPTPLSVPALVLIGSADALASAERCVAVAGRWPERFGVFQVQVYPGAVHSFDAPAPPRRLAGHTPTFDPTAANDAEARLRAHLARSIGP